MRAWRRMRDVIGTHLGLPQGQLVRGWSGQPNPDTWLAAQYEKHNEQGRRTVPPDQLLEFNVKQGWSPLCEFLGKDVPEEPFPNVNESADIEFASKVMVAISYAWLPVAGAVAASLVHACLTRKK